MEGKLFRIETWNKLKFYKKKIFTVTYSQWLSSARAWASPFSPFPLSHFSSHSHLLTHPRTRTSKIPQHRLWGCAHCDLNIQSLTRDRSRCEVKIEKLHLKSVKKIFVRLKGLRWLKTFLFNRIKVYNFIFFNHLTLETKGRNLLTAYNWDNFLYNC